MVSSTGTVYGIRARLAADSDLRHSTGMRTSPWALSIAIMGIAWVALAVSGCESARRTAGSQAAAAPATICVDGSVDEWPADAACAADADYIYVRFTVKDAEFTLQRAPAPVVVYLDLDRDIASGVQADAPSPDARGADLVIEFSPRSGGPSPGQGVAVYAVDSDGVRRVVRHADVDLSFSPTYSAEWYELRIGRRVPQRGVLADLLSRASEVRGTVAMFDDAGGQPLVCDGFVATLPPAAEESPSDADLPARIPGTLRVVSWNVLKSAPADRPDSFSRVLKAIDPDVVLLQEWSKGDASAIQAWFTAFVPSGSGWQAVKSADGDVAIVSKYPLSAVGGGASIASDDRPVRFVAAVTVSPIGDVLLGSAHLKCCGGKGTPEDARRLEEARAIARSLSTAAPLPRVRVMGGDLNLVGTRPPLDAFRAGLDADGSDLEVAAPVVLGDSTMYTWTDPASEFTPGRLDYLVWSDSSATISRQFVLNTAILSDRSLARAGIRRGDSAVSDHLPVVIDLKPLPPGASSDDANDSPD